MTKATTKTVAAKPATKGATKPATKGATKPAATKGKVDNGIPAFLDRTKDPVKLAASLAATAKITAQDGNRKIVMPKRTPTLPSEVPQPKLAKGNNGIHSRTAVLDNAKAARKLADANRSPLDTSAKSPAKPAKGKVAPVATKGKVAPAAPAKSKPVAAPAKVIKIVKGAANNTREGTKRHALVEAVRNAKDNGVIGTTLKWDGRVVTVVKADFDFAIAKGYVKVAK